MTKFTLQQEEAVFAEALSLGIVQDLSRRYLKKTCNVDHLSEIELVTLSTLNIRSISHLELCYRLKICLLSQNYIADFSCLAACPQLVKLDLSHNQISELPDADFWECLQNLKILYLHDNCFGRLSSIRNLSTASSIEIVSFHSNPISLRSSYRHHVVNTLFSLKCLDSHVVSDEEIIEDAHFPSKFCTLSPHLLLDHSKFNAQDGDINFQLSQVHALTTHVNRVMARFSPVLVIQRMIRGYFTRKFIKYYIHNRVWLMKDAIDAYRESPTPVTRTVTESSLRPRSRHTPTPKRKISHARSSSVSHRIDEDRTILEHIPATPRILREDTKFFTKSDPSKPSTTDDVAEKIGRIKKEEEDLRTTDFVPNPETLRPLVQGNEKELIMRQLQDIAKKSHKFAKSMRREIRKKKPLEVESDVASDDEKPQFRLKGVKEKVTHIDHVLEMFQARDNVGDAIREMHQKYHDNEEEVKPDMKRILSNMQKMTLDQRIYAKTKGAMAFGTLFAIDDAYRQRHVEKQQLDRKAYVDRVQNALLRGKRANRIFHITRKNAAIDRAKTDAAMLKVALNERKEYRDKICRQYVLFREQERLYEKSRASSHQFAREFNCHRSAVGKALNNHDRRTYKEESLAAAAKKVKRIANETIEGRNNIQGYKEMKHQVRQSEIAANRLELENMLVQEKEVRLKEAKERVHQIRNNDRGWEQLFPMPLQIHVGREPPPITGKLPAGRIFSGKCLPVI